MLPREYIEEIENCLKVEAKVFLESFNDKPQRGLRVNTLKGSVKDFLDKNPWKISDDDSVSWCECGFYIKDDDELPDGVVPYGKHPFHNAGVYYMQEPSAMAPVTELLIKPKDRVLDLCAAPGGKSTQIASLLNGSGILFSNEPNLGRAKILAENIERCGIKNAFVISHDPDEIKDRFAGYFNKILVDAPCSGEGMFRKNNDAILEWSMDNVYNCQKRQKQIVDAAINMLSDGGRMVYSTCTFSNAEDEDIVSYILEKYPFMTLIKMEKLLPHKIKGEGHFLAVFEKTGKEQLSELYDVTNVSSFEEGKKLKSFKELKEFLDESINGELEDIFNAEYTYLCFGQEVYALPKGCPSLRGLKVLRSGLHLGTLKKNRFEPSFALAIALDKKSVKNNMEASFEEAIDYLKGQSLSYDGNKGWYLINYQGYSLGWGKLSNNTMKNHYPKGLRILC